MLCEYPFVADANVVTLTAERSQDDAANGGKRAQSDRHLDLLANRITDQTRLVY